jgi:hypothetical protein
LKFKLTGVKDAQQDSPIVQRLVRRFPSLWLFMSLREAVFA